MGSDYVNEQELRFDQTKANMESEAETKRAEELVWHILVMLQRQRQENAQDESVQLQRRDIVVDKEFGDI